MASHTPAKIAAPDDRLSGINTSVAPVSGFPALTVPRGFTPESELPVGIEFIAGRFKEPTLY